MADRPPPGRTPTPGPTPKPTPEPQPQPTAEPTPSAAPTGSAPIAPAPAPAATPSPTPGVNPYPVLPGMLPGIDPGRAGKYTVNPQLLMPAASRADTNAETVQGLCTSLALGPPTGLPGFQTGWQAGGLADAWSRELGNLASALRTCAAKIRDTTQAYLEAEARNAADLR